MSNQKANYRRRSGNRVLLEKRRQETSGFQLG